MSSQICFWKLSDWRYWSTCIQLWKKKIMESTEYQLVRLWQNSDATDFFLKILVGIQPPTSNPDLALFQLYSRLQWGPAHAPLPPSPQSLTLTLLCFSCIVSCSEDQFLCPAPDHKCIPSVWVCDGETDCENGEDEPQDDPRCRKYTAWGHYVSKLNFVVGLYLQSIWLKSRG